MPPGNAPSPTPSRRKWRRRLALAGTLAVIALLASMLPASANNGTIWTTLPSLPTARKDLASAVAPCPPGQTGSCVYTVGGGNFATQFTTVESYNRLTNAWSTLPPLPTPRAALAAAAAPCPAGQTGTCLYAIGGGITAGGGQYLRVVESYNPVTNAWSTVASLTTARSGLAAATAPCPAGQTGTCVYAVGGWDGTNALGTVESYNPANNSWSTVRALTLPRLALGAAAASCPPGQTGTCVYAVGGYGNGGFTGVVESYNPTTNAWSPMAPVPTPRANAGVAATTCPPGQSGTCVYVVGGNNTGSLLANVDAYNPATNAWTALPSLPKPRNLLAAAAMQCPPGITGSCVYASGGYTTDINGTVEALDPPDPSED